MTSTNIHLFEENQIKVDYFANDGKGPASVHVNIGNMRDVSIFMSEENARTLVAQILAVLPLSKDEQARLDDLELNAALAAANDPQNEAGVPL